MSCRTLLPLLALALISSCDDGGVNNSASTLDVLYVVFSGTHAVTSYKVTPSTGAISVGTTTFAGNGAIQIAVHPSGNFAYVLNYDDSTVSIFEINHESGGLTSQGLPKPTGLHPTSLAVLPSGRYLFVGEEGTGLVRSFEIDTSTGELIEVAPASTATTGVLAVSVNPLSALLAFGSWTSGVLDTLEVGSGTPVATSAAAVSTGSAVRALVFHPSLPILYVLGASTLTSYSVNTSTGALTSLGTAPVGTTPRALALHPRGDALYVANSGSASISALSLDAVSGQPSTLETQTALSSIQILQVSAAGTLLFAASPSTGEIRSFQINATDRSLNPLYLASTGAVPMAMAAVRLAQ